MGLPIPVIANGVKQSQPCTDKIASCLAMTRQETDFWDARFHFMFKIKALNFHKLGLFIRIDEIQILVCVLLCRNKRSNQSLLF